MRVEEEVTYIGCISLSSVCSSFLPLQRVCARVRVRVVEMNNSADASTRPPSIKPSPLMSLNDSHSVETIKVCYCVLLYVCVCAGSAWVGRQGAAVMPG